MSRLIPSEFEGTYDKLQVLLKQLFQIRESSELDFGIYKILRQKRAIIEKFIDMDLLKEAESSFADFADFSKEQKLVEVEESRKRASEAIGTNLPKDAEVPDEFKGFPIVQDFLKRRAEFKLAVVKEDQIQGIFNTIYEFFSRYYEGGDFISKRRYSGRDHYSIPYNGQEVLLYWATFDQYYVKTSERFSNYSFTSGTLQVRLRLRLDDEAESASGSENPSNGNHFIILARERPFEFDKNDNALTIRFERRILPEVETKRLGKNVQSTLLLDVIESLKGESFKFEDQLLARREDNLSLLEKHLDSFVRGNTSDFFVHKNLGAFLSREFDFFLKNEVLDLTEIRGANTAQLRLKFAEIDALERIARKIIEFLAQIEDFQKRLFEKKKFVLRTDYCITLDKVPAEFLDEIGGNKSQVGEWRKLFDLDKATDGSLFRTKGKATLDSEFLSNHKLLVLDTKFFSQEFKERLLSHFGSLDAAIGGDLIKGENFQALGLLRSKYRGRVKCIYIDPPYNTGSDEFLYKDRYQHSSWLSMMADRLTLAKDFLDASGTIGVSIDNNELDELLKLMDSIFGRENRRSIVAVKRGSVTGPKVINPGVVNVSEFLVIYSASKSEWTPNKVFRERDRDKRYSQFILNRDKDSSKWKFISLLQAFADSRGLPKSELRKSLGESFEEELENFILDHADSVARTAALDPGKISQDAKDLKAKSKSNPERIYLLKREDHEDWYIQNGERILFYSDRLIKLGSKLVPGELVTDIWDDTLPNDLHNEGGVTLKKGKKPEKLIGRLIELATNKGDLVLDFFVGSGTSSAAAQKLGRKWIGIDFADFFDNLTLRRMKNMLFGEQSGISPACGWKGGGFFRYFYLEDYEDSLENLVLVSPDRVVQGTLDTFEDYKLKYMLDYESRSSPVLLDIRQFRSPFKYSFGPDATRDLAVDLVETFNLLISLRVERGASYKFEGQMCKAVFGENRFGKVAVIWREIESIPPEKADELRKREEAFRDFVAARVLPGGKFNRIYVNGDSLIPNAESIETEFKRLMNQGIQGDGY